MSDEVGPGASPGPTCVSGVVVAGHGVASGRNRNPKFPGGTLSMQAPFFAERGLDLSVYHPGTINVSVRPHRLVPVAPRLTIRSVKWHPTDPAEDFSFIDCRLELNGVEVPALIYYPHPETKPTHYQPDAVVEVLAPTLPGVADGVRCTLEVDRDQAFFT